jgi:hypothetical protein
MTGGDSLFSLSNGSPEVLVLVLDRSGQYGNDYGKGFPDQKTESSGSFSIICKTMDRKPT